VTQMHTEGLPLFQEPAPVARKSDPDTSHKAADSMREAAAVQRAQIMQQLYAAGSVGLTADEVDERQGWRPTTAGRRLVELVRMGLASLRYDADLEPVTRATRSGRAAQVYLAIPARGSE
jgi:hypothetical protein